MERCSVPSGLPRAWSKSGRSSTRACWWRSKRTRSCRRTDGYRKSEIVRRMEPETNSVVHGTQVRFPDRRRADHCHGRESSLPVRAVETFPNETDFFGVEPVRDELGILVAAHHPVENLVGLLVRDAEVTLVRLAMNEIGGGRFADDD